MDSFNADTPIPSHDGNSARSFERRPERRRAQARPVTPGRARTHQPMRQVRDSAPEHGCAPTGSAVQQLKRCRYVRGNLRGFPPLWQANYLYGDASGDPILHAADGEVPATTYLVKTDYPVRSDGELRGASLLGRDRRGGAERAE